MKIAGFEKRIFGWLIDFCVPLIISIPFLILFLKIDSLEVFWEVVLFFLIHYVFYIFINIPFIYVTNGKSLGQIIFGVKMVSQTSDNLKANQFILKTILTGLIPVDILNAIYMLSVRTERSIFDRLTDTVMIDEKFR